MKTALLVSAGVVCLWLVVTDGSPVPQQAEDGRKDAGLTSNTSPFDLLGNVFLSDGLPREDKVSTTTEKQGGCVPYETFYDECNTCFCAADGITAHCTLMFCWDDYYDYE